MIKSRFKNGTKLFERYITIQGVHKGIQLTLGALPMPALSSTDIFVRKLLTSCMEKGIRFGTDIFDREFFSVYVIRALDMLEIKYIMPCVNTKAVICAINEFAAGTRPATSTFRITKSKDESAEYTMIITKRRKKRKRKAGKPEKPEDAYIAFATNEPGITITLYAHRWMIETGYRMIDKQRAKTRSKNKSVRTFCFFYTILLYNPWVLLNNKAISSTNDHERIYTVVTQIDMKLVALIGLLDGHLSKGKPPPPALGSCSCTCTCSAPKMIMPLE